MIFIIFAAVILCFAIRAFRRKNVLGGWKILTVLFAFTSAWLAIALFGLRIPPSSELGYITQNVKPSLTQVEIVRVVEVVVTATPVPIKNTATPVPTLKPTLTTPTPGPTPPCPRGCAHQLPGCRIKANLGIGDKKIYYLPDQAAYAEITIEPYKGDRWFCTEDEAQKNEWVKSKE